MVNLLKSKKAQEDVDVPLGRKVPYYVFIVVSLALMISLTVMLTGRLNYAQTEVPARLEDLMIIKRFMNNPDCLAYEDEQISRIYPGIIDLAKAEQENMDGCIIMREQEPCYKIMLYDSKNKIAEVTTNNNQKCRIALKTDVFKKQYVLLRGEDGKIRPGYIQVSKNERE